MLQNAETILGGASRSLDPSIARSLGRSLASKIPPSAALLLWYQPFLEEGKCDTAPQEFWLYFHPNWSSLETIKSKTLLGANKYMIAVCVGPYGRQKNEKSLFALFVGPCGRCSSDKSQLACFIRLCGRMFCCLITVCPFCKALRTDLLLKKQRLPFWYGSADIVFLSKNVVNGGVGGLDNLGWDDIFSGVDQGRVDLVPLSINYRGWTFWGEGPVAKMGRPGIGFPSNSLKDP